MKKILAILFAVALVGGAFAQAAAPAAAAPAAPAPTVVKFADPTVTSGLTAFFGFDAYQSNNALTINKADGTFANSPAPLLGYDYANGQLFKIEPWAKAAFGNFWVQGNFGFKASRRTNVPATEATLEYDQAATLAAGYSVDGLTLSNTLVFDWNNYPDSTAASASATNYEYPWGAPATMWGSAAGAPGIGNAFSISVSKDNLEGEVDFASKLANTDLVTLFGAMSSAVTKMQVYDWYFKISKLFDVWNATIGGVGGNYYYNFRPYGMYTANTSVIYYQTTARTGTGLFFSGDSSTGSVPVYNEIDLSKWVPLSIQAGFVIPAQEYTFTKDNPLYIDWLAASNMNIAAKYTMKDVGDFQLGLIPNLGTDYETVAAAATTLGSQAVGLGQYYIAANSAVATTVYGDFNVSMVPNLTARASFDLGLGQKVSMKAGDTTGTGTATDPFTGKYYSYNLINFGVEGKYDLKDTVKGLVAMFGLYGGMASGPTYEQYSGAAWAAATAGQFFTADYTEATKIGKGLGANPLMVALRGTYTFDNKDSAYLENLYSSSYAALKTLTYGPYTPVATKTASGYYGFDTVTLNFTKMAGVGKLAISPFYTMYFGVPAASDLGITGASDIAAYNEAVADAYNPLGVSLTFTATF